jgi:hypothetical protein
MLSCDGSDEQIECPVCDGGRGRKDPFLFTLEIPLRL